MIVHDDPLQQAADAMMLEENPTDVVINEMADCVSDAVASDVEIAEGSRNVESIAEVTVSLESFVSSFMERVPADNWNSKTARQYQLGVGNILRAADLPVPDAVFSASFESIGVHQTSFENRQETEGKSKGLIARMWEAFKAACAKLAEMLTGLMNNYGKTESAVYKMRDNLISRQNQAAGTLKKDKFDGAPKWAAYLQTSSKTLTPAQSLDTACNFSKTLTEDWIKMYSKLSKTVTDKLKGGQEVAEADLPQGTPNGTNEFYEYPGLNDVAVSAGDNDINVLNAAIKVTRSSTKINEGTFVCGFGEIRDICRGLGNVGKLMGDIKRDLRIAISDLKSMSGGIDKNRVKQGPAIVSKIMGRIGTGPRTILPVLGGIAQSAYLHANASLRQYSDKDPE